MNQNMFIFFFVNRTEMELLQIAIERLNNDYNLAVSRAFEDYIERLRPITWNTNTFGLLKKTVRENVALKIQNEHKLIDENLINIDAYAKKITSSLSAILNEHHQLNSSNEPVHLSTEYRRLIHIPHVQRQKYRNKMPSRVVERKKFSSGRLSRSIASNVKRKSQSNSRSISPARSRSRSEARKASCSGEEDTDDEE